MGTQAILNCPPRLILITDRSRLAGEAFFEAIDAALRGGVEALLLREKEMPSSRLLALAARLRAVTREHGAQLIVHTQADVATAVGADGVHLAAVDMASIARLRAWLPEPVPVSVSCHHAEELALAARHGADWALLSPVFPTASHPGAPHLGVTRFRRLAADAALPVVALGGIGVNNIGRLQGAPAAVIGAILDAPDPMAAACALSAAACPS